MCPAPQLGIRTPSWIKAIPIPVPSVVQDDPAPDVGSRCALKRSSATPAASASLTEEAGAAERLGEDVLTGGVDPDLSIFAAVRTTRAGRRRGW